VFTALPPVPDLPEEAPIADDTTLTEEDRPIQDETPRKRQRLDRNKSAAQTPRPEEVDSADDEEGGGGPPDLTLDEQVSE